MLFECGFFLLELLESLTVVHLTELISVTSHHVQFEVFELILIDLETEGRAHSHVHVHREQAHLQIVVSEELYKETVIAKVLTDLIPVDVPGDLVDCIEGVSWVT